MKATSARAKARKAERALGELSLSVITKADKARILAVEIGLHALDEEQSNLKATIDGLLEAMATGFSKTEVIEELRDMSKKWRAER